MPNEFEDVDEIPETRGRKPKKTVPILDDFLMSGEKERTLQVQDVYGTYYSLYMFLRLHPQVPVRVKLRKKQVVLIRV
jgi:hypothetical protein